MDDLYRRYDAKNINYAKSAYNVSYLVEQDKLNKNIKVTLKTESYKPQIYYTTDGTTPSLSSAKYEKSILINKSLTIKAGNFKNGKLIGKLSEKAISIP